MMYAYSLSHRKKIIAEKGFASIEQLMFDDHELIKRAATEVMCNLVNCEEVNFS